MRKIFIIVLAIFTLSMVNAQEGKVKFGVKTGLNISTIYGDVQGISSRKSFHFGFLVEIPASKFVRAQPEIIYSRQGAVESQATIKYDYLNIPLMIKIYPMEKFNFQIGPQIGILLSAIVGDLDVIEQVTNVDMGFNFGFEYEFVEGIFFGTRYNLGIHNLMSDSNNSKNRNSVFQLSVGAKF